MGLNKLLIQAGNNLKEGFVTAKLGRKRAAMLFLFLRSWKLTSSCLFWMGLLGFYGVYAKNIPLDNVTAGAFVFCILIGLCGVYYDLVQMAEDPEQSKRGVACRR